MNIAELETQTREDLADLARDLGISGANTLRKQELIFRLLQAQTEQQGNIFSGGFLEIVDDGYGFLRGEQLPARPERRLRLAVADPALRPAHRRLRHRPGAAAQGQREVLRPAARRGGQRPRPRSGEAAALLRNAHRRSSRTELIDLETDARQPLDPADRPRCADRPRPARADRLAAEGRQDDAAQEDRQRHHRATTRHPPAWSR